MATGYEVRFTDFVDQTLEIDCFSADVLELTGLEVVGSIEHGCVSLVETDMVVLYQACELLCIPLTQLECKTPNRLWALPFGRFAPSGLPRGKYRVDLQSIEPPVRSAMIRLHFRVVYMLQTTIPQFFVIYQYHKLQLVDTTTTLPKWRLSGLYLPVPESPDFKIKFDLNSTIVHHYTSAQLQLYAENHMGFYHLSFSPLGSHRMRSKQIKRVFECSHTPMLMYFVEESLMTKRDGPNTPYVVISYSAYA